MPLFFCIRFFFCTRYRSPVRAGAVAAIWSLFWSLCWSLPARAQVLLHKDDYGPVISSSVWYGSRLPGLSCNMPKVHQVAVPICPDCVLIEARPHAFDTSLVRLELVSDRPLNQLVSFFGEVSDLDPVVSASSHRKVFLSDPHTADLPRDTFHSTSKQLPYVSIEEVSSSIGDSRRIMLITGQDDSYNCVFDHNG